MRRTHEGSHEPNANLARGMTRQGIVIYSPYSAGMFHRHPYAIGGAERQMGLLAVEMARRGYRVSLIVYPISERTAVIPPGLTLIERGDRPPTTGSFGAFREAARIFRALRAAGGRVVVVRSGTPVLGIIALFCLVARRRLVFSSANDFDFVEGGRAWNRQRRTALYALGVRRAAVVVVQSVQQLELARRRFPRIRKLVRIPSFARVPDSVPPRTEPSAFYWVGRLVEYKQPLRYVELADEFAEARFVLVLQTPESPSTAEAALVASLESAAARLPNLELRKNVPHSVLNGELATAVAMVSTSSFEGMPNTFLEAWSNGVPVLSLSFDPDGVIARENLGIAAGDSWQSFVAGARTLWDNRRDRRETAERVHAYVRRAHSFESVGDRWEAVIDGVAASQTTLSKND